MSKIKGLNKYLNYISISVWEWCSVKECVFLREVFCIRYPQIAFLFSDLPNANSAAKSK